MKINQKENKNEKENEKENKKLSPLSVVLTNRSISTMEDRIPGWLQHCWKACCKKGGCHGRWACIIWR